VIEKFLILDSDTSDERPSRIMFKSRIWGHMVLLVANGNCDKSESSILNPENRCSDGVFSILTLSAEGHDRLG
jgi:hypothetical protein